MTDRDKFNAWLQACPVILREVKDFAFGYVEVHVTLPDERDEYSDLPEDIRIETR